MHRVDTNFEDTNSRDNGSEVLTWTIYPHGARILLLVMFKKRRA